MQSPPVITSLSIITLAASIWISNVEVRAVREEAESLRADLECQQEIFDAYVRYDMGFGAPSLEDGDCRAHFIEEPNAK